MRAEVVVIGSGVTGLTAAALLARQGKRVIVLEQGRQPGGVLRQFRRDGLGFDVGFHYSGCLGPGEILDQLWRYCGVRPAIPVVALGESGHDHFEFAESARKIRAYYSYPRLEAELAEHFPGDREAVRTYFETIRSVCEAVPFYRTELPLTPFLRGYKPTPTPLSDYFDGLRLNPRLRAVLAAPGFLYGVPEQLASVEVHAMVAHGYYCGAYIVDGGGQRIVDAFLAVLAGFGVDLHTGSAAVGVELSGGSIAAVRTAAGERISCEQVIYTGHPSGAVDLVPAGVFRPAYVRRLRELRNTISMFAVFGRCGRRLDYRDSPLNYYLLPERGALLESSRPDPKRLRPLMLTGTRPTPEERLRSSDNGFIVLRPGYWQELEPFYRSDPANRPPAYLEFKERVVAEMVAEVQKRWEPISGKLNVLAAGTPLTFRDILALPEGGVYGAMHCLGQFNPDIRTRLPGFFLGGQSTLMTGVAGASLSALVAAGEIVGLEPLWEKVRSWN